MPDTPQITPGTPAWSEFVCKHHQPTEAEVERIGRCRAAAAQMIDVINENCPVSADRSAAVRKVRDALMTANASIVLRGFV